MRRGPNGGLGVDIAMINALMCAPPLIILGEVNICCMAIGWGRRFTFLTWDLGIRLHHYRLISLIGTDEEKGNPAVILG